MLTSFLAFLQKEQLITDKQKTTLLAVSGGVDSVVLCHLFKQADLPFAIAHCHFNLRGAEADQASQLVEHLAQYYQVPYYNTKFETKAFATRHKVSVQMAARTLRYQFFYQLLHQQLFAQIATAHHWDDTVETILFNLIRGTGIKGLCGIQPIHGVLIRPLLFASKREIIAYAKQEALIWNEDSSNQSLYYQRNFIRHKIIPLCQKLNPNFNFTLKETVAKLSDVSKILQYHINQLKKIYITTHGDNYCVKIGPITHLPGAATIAFELVGKYGFTFKQIQSLMGKHTRSGKQLCTKHYILYVDREQWFICKKQRITRQEKTIAAHNRLLHYAHHIFYFQLHNQQGYTIPPTTKVAALAYHKLQFPLILRPWKAGDFFYPLGMKGRKKISDFLIDLKVPITKKEKVFVITSHHQIIWVVGYRIDQRFRIDGQTEKIFEITDMPH